MESRFTRASRFGEIFSVPRIRAKKSIDYMANALGVSRKTVQNWEKGVSSPSFRDSLLWFRYLDSNPNPYLLHYQYSDLYPFDSSPSDSNLDMIIEKHIQHAPMKEQLQIYHLLTGYHGSVFAAMLQMYICDALIDLPAKNAVANMVLSQHLLENRLYSDSNLSDDILPDVDILSSAISNASDAISSGDKSYLNFNSEFFDRENVRHRIAYALSFALKRSGMSQEYISMELGVSTNTIRNWLSEKTEPTFFQCIEWFTALQLNPYPYMSYVIYPRFYTADKFGKSSELTNEISNCIKALPVKYKRQLVYLFHGRHGSSWISMLQMYICWSSLRLSSKIIISVMIRTLYQSQLSGGLISCPDDIAPDMCLLDSAIHQAQESILNGNNGYMFIEENPNGK